MLVETTKLILLIKCLSESEYMIMMFKRPTLIPQRVKVGLGGIQSGGVTDLSRGDTHGRSQQHVCMILMGGQAAGHPHI